MDRFEINISKDALSQMPVITYPAAISLIDSAAEAHAALRALLKEKIVGFDTETRPSFRKGCVHKVALMHISTMERCFFLRIPILLK